MYVMGEQIALNVRWTVIRKRMNATTMNAFCTVKEPAYFRYMIGAEHGKEKLKMAKYTTCDDCGANLDHGESCDCKEDEERQAEAEEESTY